LRKGRFRATFVHATLTPPALSRRKNVDMNETPQQYIQRILGHVQGKDAMKVQATTPKKLAALIKNVSPSKLRKRPAPDKWSVTEILAHLGDAEIVIAWRIRSILGAPGTPIQAYDQDAWVAAGRYSERNPRQCLEVFRVVREANLMVLKSLKPEQWKHHGMHSERGEETIERILHMMAGHDLNHLQQIERILTAKPKSSRKH
jgi:DinB superfamily